MNDPTKIGKVASTYVQVQNHQVQVTSGGRAFGWTPEEAEQIAGLLLRAARTARAQTSCIAVTNP